MKTRLFILVQHLTPHHLLSRFLGLFAACRTSWLKNLLIRTFIKKYQVNMSEAIHPDASDYNSFNDFFTRALKPGTRPLNIAESAILCPADGAISAIGSIVQDQVFQAKGKQFSLSALLGGDDAMARSFNNGSFATIYLSPRDYHRVHMPVAGTLESMSFVPGKLFSVNQVTANNIDALFARNERVVSIFRSSRGPVAVILVGAMIVASIETVWSGTIAPGGKQVLSTRYQDGAAPQLARGEEMGRFKLGSTAIILFGENTLDWNPELDTGSQVQIGQALGHYR